MTKKRKTLKEAILADPNKGQPEWDRLVAKAAMNPYFQKVLKETEGTLQGDVDTETDATDALGIVYDQIIMGIEEHHPLDFARIFRTDKSEIKIPVGTYGTATKRADAGTFSAGEKTTSFVTVAIDKEYGSTISWTKAHIDDATWDVLAEQMQGAGYGIKHKLCERLLRELQAITVATSAGGAVVAIANQSAITWAEFLSVLAAVDVAGTGPADFCLVSPKRYWQLMALDQFVNSLYAGSDEVMRTGVAKSMLGVTVIRVSDLGDVAQLKYDSQDTNFTLGETVTGATSSATGIVLADRDDGVAGVLTLGSITGIFQDDEELNGSVGGASMAQADGVIGAWIDIYALNSKKALALAYRRDVEIEPYEYPDENRYGFVASVRAKADTVVPSSVAIGQSTAA